MDETTLHALVRGPEGERVERKERLTASKDDVCKAICAFANDLPRSGEPGVVIIGQADKGKPVGLPITDRLLRDLADLRTNGGILPFPQTSVRPFEVDGVLVAIIIVEPSSDPPVRYNGRTWIRVGPTTRQATAQEEVILTERRQAANLPYDARALPSATLDDLDIVRFDEGLLSQFVAEDVVRENGRPVTQQLASLRFTAPPDFRPTPTGILIVGKEPEQHIPGAPMFNFFGSTVTS